MRIENYLQLWQLQSDAENISDQNCGVQTLEPRALRTDLLLLLNVNGFFWTGLKSKGSRKEQYWVRSCSVYISMIPKIRICDGYTLLQYAEDGIDLSVE